MRAAAARSRDSCSVPSVLVASATSPCSSSKSSGVIAALRANTTALLRRLTDTQWASMGTHSESGGYSAIDWLKTYAEHLEKHTGQLERSLAAWEKR